MLYETELNWNSIGETENSVLTLLIFLQVSQMNIEEEITNTEIYVSVNSFHLVSQNNETQRTEENKSRQIQLCNMLCNPDLHKHYFFLVQRHPVLPVSRQVVISLSFTILY